MRISAACRRGSLAVRAVAGVVLLAAAGCTICPDPFDYSGPVPNGAPPQNDFRARSGGIAPLGGVSRPWPPVVRAVPGAGDASRTVAVVAETPDSGEPEDVGEQVAPGAAAPVQPAAAETNIEPADGDGESSPVTAEAPTAELLPAAATPWSDDAPQCRDHETSGWRPRR